MLLRITHAECGYSSSECFVSRRASVALLIVTMDFLRWTYLVTLPQSISTIFCKVADDGPDSLLFGSFHKWHPCS